MASVAQWSIDQFWGQLQNLKTQIDRVDAALTADKSKLTQLYTYAREHYDPTRDAWLTPLIHRNSELRLNYLAPVRRKFNEAVTLADKALRSAGYTTPNLSGMGLVFAIAPAAAVAIVVVALSAVAIVWRLTQQQTQDTDAMARLMNDPSTTTDQKIALAKLMQQRNAAGPRNPLGFNFGDLLPLAGIVAAIVLGPRILDMVGTRRRST